MKKLVGIILTAGAGTRLGPITGGINGNNGVSKGLVPVADKPSIYYPLSTLIQMGIEDILIIASPDTIGQYRSTIDDGTELGITISYAIQQKLCGIADAFVIGESFIGNNDVALLLGDNVFCGSDFAKEVTPTTSITGAHIFAYKVKDPQRFGVVEFDDDGVALSIEEKPHRPKSNYAVPGLYLYDASVVEIAKRIPMSDRGEFEISSVNEAYLEREQLTVSTISPNIQWFDVGTAEALSAAAEFVEAYQYETGTLYGSPELGAFEMGFITAKKLRELAERPHLRKSRYGQILKREASSSENDAVIDSSQLTLFV